MTMKLSEAIRLGGLLKKRQAQSGDRYSDYGCALQMAALAAGREDLAYSKTGGPNYCEIDRLFGLPLTFTWGVWPLNDAVRSNGTFTYTLDQIADWVEREERELGLWDEVDGKAAIPEAELTTA